MSGNSDFRKSISIACCNLRSAFNTGSILRTADAAGIGKVFLCGTTPFPPHDKLTRTSRGTHESVDWEYRNDILPLIAEKKEEGVHVMAVETGINHVDHTKADYKRPLLLIVGNEAKGLPEEVLEQADSAVSIPMHGVKNSINVAVAAGIVLYEAIRNI